MVKEKMLDKVAMALLLIGGLNWGLAVFDVNLVTALTGSYIYFAKLIYGLVGLSAIRVAYMKFMK